LSPTNAHQAAEQFISQYYQAINNLAPLAGFYTSSSPRYSGVVPDISINGLSGLTPAQYEAMIAEQSNATTTANTTALQAKTNGATTSTRPPHHRDQRPPTPTETKATATYLIDSVDAHVINPSFALGDPPAVSGNPPAGQRASILVQVTGKIVFGRGRGAEEKGFNEVFVLAPNWDALGKHAPRNARRWLVSSQTFRAL
jgi:NTF2-related export protein 1/2